jgi:AraC-like DNA-binding protein
LDALTNLQAGKSVKEAANDAGYASPQHFSKAFKKFHGMCPSSVQVSRSLGDFPFLAFQTSGHRTVIANPSVAGTSSSPVPAT